MVLGAFLLESIDYNYNRELYSNICSNDWFTIFAFWFSNTIK